MTSLDFAVFLVAAIIGTGSGFWRRPEGAYSWISWAIIAIWALLKLLKVL